MLDIFLGALQNISNSSYYLRLDRELLLGTFNARNSNILISNNLGVLDLLIHRTIRFMHEDFY